MLVQQLVLVYCMICFTMIGAQQSLTKALMPMFIHELQPKMLKKNYRELSDLERDIIIKHMWGRNYCTTKIQRKLHL